MAEKLNFYCAKTSIPATVIHSTARTLQSMWTGLDPATASAHFRCVQAELSPVPACRSFAWCAAKDALRCGGKDTLAADVAVHLRSASMDTWMRQASVLKRGGWTVNLTRLQRDRCSPLPSPSRQALGRSHESSADSASCATASSVYVGFLHIDKAGGTSMREWFQAVEMDDATWQFVSHYTHGTCASFHRDAGVLKCASIATQRSAVLRLLNRSRPLCVGEEGNGAAGGPPPHGPRGWRVAVEYHAQDAAQYSAHASLLSTPSIRWGPKVILTMLVREPHSWYLSMVAYMRAQYGKYAGLSLEQSVAREPNPQTRQIAHAWRRSWRSAMPLMTLAAPLERADAFVASLCRLMGLPPGRCYALPRANEVTSLRGGEGCVRGLSDALVHSAASTPRAPSATRASYTTACAHRPPPGSIPARARPHAPTPSPPAPTPPVSVRMRVLSTLLEWGQATCCAGRLVARASWRVGAATSPVSTTR